MVHSNALSLIMVLILIITLFRQSLIPWTLLMSSLFRTIFKQPDKWNVSMLPLHIRLQNFVIQIKRIRMLIILRLYIITYNISIHSVNKLTPTNSHLVVHLKVLLIPFLPLFLHAPLILFIVIYIALVTLSWFQRKQIPHTPSLVGDTDVIKIVGISTTVLMTLFMYKSVLVALSLVLPGLDPLR